VLARQIKTANNMENKEIFDLAIICGYGILPVEIAAEAIAVGRKPYLIGLEGEAEPAIEKFPGEYMSWGQVGKLFRLLDNYGIDEVVFAGGVRKRPELHRLKLDWGAVASLPRVLSLMLGGDNTLLSGAINLFETRGIAVVGAHQIAPRLLAERGRIGGPRPGARDIAAMQLAFSACKALGAFDIGQASVAEAGRVVALEGVEGTDAMLQRIAEMRINGRLPVNGHNGVLVKTMKPGQDMRADLPAIGPKTIESVVKAGLRGIGLEAGCTLILERDTTIAKAQRQGIFIYGLTGAGIDLDG
jgi:UDP-2,3-diacylglucosamine hydrolase